MRIDSIAGANPTIVGERFLVMLAGEGADVARAALERSVADASSVADIVDQLARVGGDDLAFVVAECVGAVVRAQFRGAAFALRVMRADGTEVVFRARQSSGWSTITETDCVTVDFMDVAAATGRVAPSPAAVGSLSSSRLTYRAETAVPEAAPGSSDLPRTTLEFAGGRQLDVERTILIGRSPRAERTTAAALPVLFPIASEGHAVSRTHLKISVEGGRVLLEDLNSTNGTAVVASSGEVVALHPGQPAVLSDGMTVTLGDQVAFTVVSLP